MIAVVHLSHNLTFHAAQPVVEDGQAQGSQLEGSCIKSAAHTLLRFEENGGQVLLISGQNIQAEFARALDHAVAGGIRSNGHDHQWRFKGSLGHPAGGEAIDVLSFGHATDEDAMGDFAEQGLLGICIQTGR